MTALLNSDILDGCSFKSQVSRIPNPGTSPIQVIPFENQSKFMRSFVACDLNFLNTVNISMPPSQSVRLFNHSTFTIPNSKINLLRGTPHSQPVSSDKKEREVEFDSPFKVSGEDSEGGQ